MLFSTKDVTLEQFPSLWSLSHLVFKVLDQLLLFNGFLSKLKSGCTLLEDVIVDQLLLLRSALKSPL